jgi:hypothetical protein
MTRWTSDSKSRKSKKALAILRELEGGKPAEHLKPVEPKFIAKELTGTLATIVDPRWWVGN